MRKRYFGRLFSIALSIMLAFTSVIPSHAMEGAVDAATEETIEDEDDLEESEGPEENGESGKEGVEEPQDNPEPGSETEPEGPENEYVDPENDTEDEVTDPETGTEEPVEEMAEAALFGSTDPEETYTVRFDNSAGKDTVSFDDLTDMKAGDLLELPNLSADQIPAYKTFGGWYDNDESGNKITATALTNELIALAVGRTITLYAVYDPIIVSFDLNGGYGDPVDPILASEDAVFPYSNTWRRNGYTRDGWCENANGYGNRYRFGNAIPALTASKTFYLYWMPNVYDFSYGFTNGGAKSTASGASYPEEVRTGEILPAITNPVYDGFTFIGWNTERDGSGWYYKSGITLAEDFVEDITYDGKLGIYAIWRQVTYDLNGGEGEAITPTPANPNAVLADNPEWSRFGYELSGWNTKPDGQGTHYDFKGTLPESVDASIKLYAEWTVKTEYDIVFNPNGGEFEEGVTPPSKITLGQAIGLIPNPVLAGKKVIGWNTLQNPTGDDPGYVLNSNTVITVDNLADYYSGTGPITVYAQWGDANPEGTVAVSFDTGYGSAVPTQYVRIGKKARVPEDPTWLGGYYAFDGWYAESDYETSFDFDEPVAEDTVVYAKWTAVYTVNFVFHPVDSEGSATVLYTTKVKEGEPVEKPANPSIEARIFVKWCEDRELNRAYDFSSKITGNTTIYGEFKPITFKVKFDANGGKGTMAPQVIEFGSGEKLRKNTFTKGKETFYAWTTRKLNLNSPEEDWSGVDYFYDEEYISTYCKTDGQVITLYAFWYPQYEEVTFHFGYDYYPDYQVEQDEDILSRDTAIIRMYYGISPYGSDSVPYSFDRQGWYFGGWYTAETGGKSIDKNKPYDGSYKDLYARWTEISYNVTFHSNLSDDTTVTKTYKISDESEEVIKFEDIFTDPEVLAEAELRGPVLFWSSYDNRYATSSFSLYWFLRNENYSLGRGAPSFDVDIYAHWNPAHNYTVMFVYGDSEDGYYEPTSRYGLENLGKYGYGHMESVAKDENLYITGDEFVNRCYKLTGWTYTTADGTTKNIGTKATFKNLGNPGELIIFRAKWAAKESEYKLTLVTNGSKIAADSSVKELKKAYKSSENYTLPVMAKTGYTFRGWFALYNYYVSDGLKVEKVGKEYDNASGYGAYGNLTLYAVFDTNVYYVSFDKSGGTISIDEPYDGYSHIRYYNVSYPLKQLTYDKPGYKFSHWEYNDDAGTVKTIGAKGNIKNLTLVNGKRITLKAVWTPNKYTITYSLGTGASTGEDSATIYYPGEAATKITIKEPVRPGWTFDGWTLSMKDKKAAITAALIATEDPEVKALDAASYGNIVLTANWKVKNYGFRFLDKDGTVLRTVDPSNATAFSQTRDFTADAMAISLLPAMTGNKKSVSGFALKQTDITPKYKLNTVYKIADVVKAVDPTGAAAVIDLYVITEDQKFFYTLVNGATGVETAVNYAPSKGATVKAPVVPGYTFKEWTYSGGTKETDFTIKDTTITIKSPATVNGIRFVANYDSTRYTITIIPGANNVIPAGLKYPVSASGFEYKYGDEIAYSSTAAFEIPYPEWTREGYTLVGYAKTKSPKSDADFVTSEGGLKADKKNNVKVYAIWKVNGYNISYAPTGSIINPYTSSWTYVDYGKLKKSTFANYGKAVALPKKVTVEGFTFLGWTVMNNEPGKYDVITNKSGYVTKIGTRNTADITMMPVFRENTYTLKLNPNGGVIQGRKKKPFVLRQTVGYTEDVLPYIRNQVGGVTADKIDWARRPGYDATAVSLSSNGKKTLEPYAIRSGQTITGYRGLSAKNKATVTLYVNWIKLTKIPKPVIHPWLDVEDSRLLMNMDFVAECTQVQYSTDPAFKNNVVTVRKDGKFQQIDSGCAAKVYYVRARYGYYDSCRDPVYGPWSNTERAAKASEGVAHITVYDVTDGTCVAQSRSVKAIIGSKLKESLGEPARAGMTFGGWFTDAECTVPVADATEVSVDGATVYAKWTTDPIAP